jgi:TonB family protein
MNQMPIIRLVLQPPAPPPSRKAEPPLLELSNLGRGYFPGKQIPISILIHIVLFFAVLLLQILGYPIGEPRIPEIVTAVHRPIPKVVVYLPLVGGGSPGMFFPATPSKEPQKKASVTKAPRKKGFSFPGPQPIVSDVPNATNPIQTILQPQIEKPPVLQPLVPLPNLVQIAGTSHRQQLELKEPVARPPSTFQPRKPDIPEAPADEPLMISLDLVQTRKKEPTLVLPQAQRPQSAAKPVRPVSRQAEPAPPSDAEAMIKESLAQTPPPVPSSGIDPRDLLALSPMPAPPELPFDIPEGEARGRFAISPEPSLATSETEPGSKIGFASEKEGSAEGPGAGTGDQQAGNQTSTPSGTGGAEGTAKDGASSGGGSGKTADAKAGSKLGSGSGTGLGPGTGAGAGPGKGPFSGISIVGGADNKDTSAKTVRVARARKPLQTSYGLTIVSTGTSGGGLPSFDVFSHEQIYTVYLDMRRTEMDSAPSWTLEFAVLPGASYEVRENAKPTQVQQGLVLPFPTLKQYPPFPAETVRKHRGEMVIVYGIINTDGKLEQATVKQSPDPASNETVLAALSKWTFRPARLNGAPVPVKVLMGIPLWSPETP